MRSTLKDPHGMAWHDIMIVLLVTQKLSREFVRHGDAKHIKNNDSYPVFEPSLCLTPFKYIITMSCFISKAAQ